MYTPKSPPENLTVQTLWAELNEIKSVLQRLVTGQITFSTTYQEPQKPTTGRTYYADGTSWDPGSGEGPYIYLDNDWWPLITTTGIKRPRPGFLTLKGYAPITHLDVIIKAIPPGSLTLSRFAISCSGYIKNGNTRWDCGATTWDSSGTLWDTVIIHDVEKGSLQFAGFAPSTRTHVPWAQPVPSHSLTLTSYAPIATHDHVIPISNRNLTLTATAPSVSVTV